MTSSDVGGTDAHQLLRRASEGDDAATGALVRQYVRRATLLARQLVGDADEAEDVVAEAFVVALERAATFREGEPVGPWLYGIVRRLAVRQLRRAARRRWLLLRWRPEPPRVSDPASTVEARDTIDRVAHIVKELPEMQRQCFSLVVHDGLDMTEVATMFDIAPSTVRQHVHRAREAIRVKLHA